ncbi:MULTISPECIES: GTP-binding protein [Streptomyces]|uniref:GTP-binding protein n=1 Tax=Streptomyces TaxID=1883 RepID=UPI00163BF59C|nr:MULTISPECIES: ATP/GTP-binding protein [Streptomyces]MBC2875996.1 ATP/GTP-binding protein [Streptomyces sp. TYQ1024]UBI38363.1 ATP/GTP-binding protein [Streptomyces mobaraensis]UKW30947.1 ATP/GTP-binding protein [Streptomyces sp. TYQ1024]
MDSANSEGGRYLPPTVRTSVKIVIAGPLGVGKTTLIGSLSEIPPLRTEETMTQAGQGVDDVLPGKATTTVAMDFGRITLNRRRVLYLFGTPGQPRFFPLWRHLTHGALGALALIDTRRLEASFDVLGHLEDLGVPFAVAANAFPDAPVYPAEELREALDLLPDTPVMLCDARDRASSARALVTLVDHLYTAAAAASLEAPAS